VDWWERFWGEAAEDKLSFVNGCELREHGDPPPCRNQATVPLRISVVIATLNRAPMLAMALDGLREQQFPTKDYEVIVVDNGSTDGTSALVSTRAKSSANLRYIFEPSPGVSIARNTGWRASGGAWVAFLDDDAIPQPDWLTRIMAAFDHASPTPSCVGGRVEPIYEVSPPDWVKGRLLDFLTVVDHAREPFFIRDVLHGSKLVSANMAFQKAALDRAGGFHPELDRIGDNLLSGGEVLLQLQLEKLDLPIYYDPAIFVRHHVSAGRLTRRWLEDRAFWGGVSDSLMSYLNRPPTLWWALRTLSWSVRSVLGSPLLIATLLRRSSDPDVVQSRCMAWHRLGSVVGAIRAISLSLISRKAPEQTAMPRAG
jgi:glycosyltransferase involved in cell wall biosynthesis